MVDDQSQEAGKIDTAEMERLLAERSDSELRLMLHRLTKSCEQLSDYNNELALEQQDLKEEGRQLHDTISLMMKETRKLQIGMGNCVEPTLEEGPLDFVGRFWERVRPRDNQILVNENIGELKKPPMMEDGPLIVADPMAKQFDTIRNTATAYVDDIRESTGPHLEEFQSTAARQAEIIRSSANDLQGAATRRVKGLRSSAKDIRGTAVEQLSGLQERSSELIAPATERLTEAVGHQRTELLRQQSAEFREAAHEHLSGAARTVDRTTSRIVGQSVEALAPAREQLAEAVVALESATAPLWKQAMSQWYSFAGMPSAPQHSTSEDEDAIGLMGMATPQLDAQLPSTERVDIGAGLDLQQKVPRQNQDSTHGEAGTEQAPANIDIVDVSCEINSRTVESQGEAETTPLEVSPEDKQALLHESILIEARIKLDDGSVQVARVSASDRCKDVAARFVRENSLKAWFEDPVCRFLKQAEDDAETFPAVVEGELLEIRQRFKR